MPVYQKLKYIEGLTHRSHVLAIVLPAAAVLLQVDKSSAAHRPKGALGWQEADAQQDNQKSIKSFFGAAESKEAAKKQRLN